MTWANRLGIPTAVILFLLAQWANYDYLHAVPVEHWSAINGWFVLVYTSIAFPGVGYLFLGLLGHCIDQIIEKKTQ